MVAADWKSRVDSYTGHPVPYCASEQFPSSGILAGDRLYVLALSEGRDDLLVIGRFDVAARAEHLDGDDSRSPLFTRAEALELIGTTAHGVPLYGSETDTYLLPRGESASAMGVRPHRSSA